MLITAVYVSLAMWCCNGLCGHLSRLLKLLLLTLSLWLCRLLSPWLCGCGPSATSSERQCWRWKWWLPRRSPQRWTGAAAGATLWGLTGRCRGQSVVGTSYWIADCVHIKELWLLWTDLQLPIIVYITWEWWLVQATAVCALMLRNILLSALVCVGDSPLGILDNWDTRMYPLGRFPIHPLRILGADTLGNKLGELCPRIYQGGTSTWCLVSTYFVY